MHFSPVKHKCIYSLHHNLMSFHRTGASDETEIGSLNFQKFYWNIGHLYCCNEVISVNNAGQNPDIFI